MEQHLDCILSTSLLLAFKLSTADISEKGAVSDT